MMNKSLHGDLSQMQTSSEQLGEPTGKIKPFEKT